MCKGKQQMKIWKLSLIATVVTLSASANAATYNLLDKDVSYSYWIENEYEVVTDSMSVTLNAMSFDSSSGEIHNAYISHASERGLGVCGHEDLIPWYGSVRCTSSFSIGGGLASALNGYDGLLFEYGESVQRPIIVGYNSFTLGYSGQFTAWYGAGDTPNLLGLTADELSNLYDSELVRYRGGGPITFQYTSPSQAIDWMFVGYLPDPTTRNANYFLASIDYVPATVSTIPLPGAIWLFGSGLIGFMGFAKRKKV